MRSAVLISLLPLLLTLAPSAVFANSPSTGNTLSHRALQFKQVDLSQRAVQRRNLRQGKRQDDYADEAGAEASDSVTQPSGNASEGAPASSTNIPPGSKADAPSNEIPPGSKPEGAAGGAGGAGLIGDVGQCYSICDSFFGAGGPAAPMIPPGSAPPTASGPAGGEPAPEVTADGAGGAGPPQPTPSTTPTSPDAEGSAPGAGAGGDDAPKPVESDASDAATSPTNELPVSGALATGIPDETASGEAGAEGEDEEGGDDCEAGDEATENPGENSASGGGAEEGEDCEEGEEEGSSDGNTVSPEGGDSPGGASASASATPVPLPSPIDESTADAGGASDATDVPGKNYAVNTESLTLSIANKGVAPADATGGGRGGWGGWKWGGSQSAAGSQTGVSAPINTQGSNGSSGSTSSGSGSSESADSGSSGSAGGDVASPADSSDYESPPIIEETAPAPISSAAQTSAETPAETSAPSSGGGSSGGSTGTSSGGAIAQSIQETILEMHNDARDVIGATHLKWADDIAADAQAYAEKCYYKHSGNPKYGENIAAGSGLGTPVDGLTNMWADEKADYDREYGVDKPEPSENGPVVGHWTQMVWKNTTEIGCGVTDCKNGLPGTETETSPAWNQGTFYVCNYREGGNMIGEYRYNVFKT